MGIPEELPFISVEDYLESERDSEVRHEYIGGQVYAMSGASEAHNLISGNIFAALHAHLRGSPCRAFINDMKVRLSIAGDDVFYYPDVFVTCDPADRESHYKTSPKLVFEVLSPASERTDRREKFLSYQRLPSLEEYVLVDQRRRAVTVFRRSGDWEPVPTDKNGEFALPSVGITLAMDTVYEEVDVGG